MDQGTRQPELMLTLSPVLGPLSKPPLVVTEKKKGGGSGQRLQGEKDNEKQCSILKSRGWGNSRFIVGSTWKFIPVILFINYYYYVLYFCPTLNFYMESKASKKRKKRKKEAFSLKDFLKNNTHCYLWETQVLEAMLLNTVDSGQVTRPSEGYMSSTVKWVTVVPMPHSFSLNTK